MIQTLPMPAGFGVAAATTALVLVGVGAAHAPAANSTVATKMEVNRMLSKLAYV